MLHSIMADEQKLFLEEEAFEALNSIEEIGGFVELVVCLYIGGFIEVIMCLYIGGFIEVIVCLYIMLAVV